MISSAFILLFIRLCLSLPPKGPRCWPKKAFNMAGKNIFAGLLMKNVRRRRIIVLFNSSDAVGRIEDICT